MPAACVRLCKTDSWDSIVLDIAPGSAHCTEKVLRGAVDFQACIGPLTAAQWLGGREQHCVDSVERPYGERTFETLRRSPPETDKDRQRPW